MDLLKKRAEIARAKAAYYSGETDRHPFGASGEGDLLPVELTSNCGTPRVWYWVKEGGYWQRCTASWRVCEWGNAAGVA